MGRSRRPAERSQSRPYGPKWTAYRKALTLRWFAAGQVCYYCRHKFTAPGLIEVCHLISPIVRPDLAWDPGNLAPGHGSTARRCPTCDLNCNYVAAIAPDAVKDDNGADLPFTDQLIARQVRKRAQFQANNGGRNSKPAITGDSQRKSAEAPVVLEHPIDSQGRDW